MCCDQEVTRGRGRRPGRGARGARRHRAADRRRLRPLQRPHHRPPARRRGRGGSRRYGVVAGGRRSRCGCRAPSSSRWRPRRWPSRAGRRRHLPRRGDPGRDHPLRASWRASAPRASSDVQLDTGVPVVFGVLTTEDVARRWPGRRTPAATTWARRPRRVRSRWPASPNGSLPGRPEPVAGSGDRAPTLDAVLKLVLPKGSLEQATLELFEAADLAVRRSSDGRLQGHHRRPPHRRRAASCARRRSPPTWPRACSTSASPAGTGSRRPRATSCRWASCEYSKATANPFRIVVAVPEDSPWDKVEDLPDGVRVSTEYPELTRRFFAERGIEADVRLSYGATEAKVPDIVDCIVESPRPAGRCGPPASGSSTRSCPATPSCIANPAAYADPAKRHAMDQLTPCSRACSRPGARCW